MFKSWGTWLGIDSQNGDVKEEGDSFVEDRIRETSKQTPVAESEQNSGAVRKDAECTQPVQTAVDFSGCIYNFASSASNKLLETAQTLKKSVEEGKINGIIDKTILGDFHKEQQKFVQDRKSKKCSAAVPLWVGYNDEDTIQQQILALSTDKRNFLRDPPAGVQFHLDFEQMYPVAMVMLEEDELLRKMRFHLVPKQVKEQVFWKNYFYRVSLIKQSAQLTALAAQQAAERRNADKSGSSCEDPHQKDVVKWKTPPAMSTSKLKPSEDEEEISTSPPVSEFVSDAFYSCKINKDDLRREIEQLVLDKQELPRTQQEIADWERELQEFDVLDDNENHGDIWEELEEMLKGDS